MRPAAYVLLCVCGAACMYRPLVGSRIASNETSAVASCVVILAGQATFHKTDYYGKGSLVYANSRDGKGIYDMYELPDGTRVGLIDRSLAMSLDGRGQPKAGYNVTTLNGSADGGKYDPEKEFAVCATPAQYGKGGRNMYVMDVGGTVYQADPVDIYPGLRKGDWVMPLSEYPSAADLKRHWIAVGSM